MFYAVFSPFSVQCVFSFKVTRGSPMLLMWHLFLFLLALSIKSVSCHRLNESFHLWAEQSVYTQQQILVRFSQQLFCFFPIICKDHITVIYVAPQIERGRIEKLRKKQQVLIRWRIASVRSSFNLSAKFAKLITPFFARVYFESLFGRIATGITAAIFETAPCVLYTSANRCLLYW